MEPRAAAAECNRPICTLGTNVTAAVPGAPPTAVRGGVWSQHLPYAAEIPVEAAHNLAEIKKGLADAVAKRVIHPGLRYWCGRLTDHLVLYNYLLPVEDHANLVVLLFRFFAIEGMDETLQERTATILRRLLKKRDLMPSTAVVVDWRALHRLLTKYFFCKLRRTSEVHRGLGDAIVKLTKEARRFFAPTATAEILRELCPRLCPHDEVCFTSGAFLSLLLPTNSTGPAATSETFLGWFEQLFDVWGWIRNTPDWDYAFVQLYARVAKDNLGGVYLEWSPHMPWLFNKFLAMLNLPVGSRSPTAHQYGVPWNVVMLLPGGRSRFTKIAILIVYLMKPGGEVLGYLERLLSSVKAFYHPSNTGRWSSTLAAFMLSLCEVFAMRAREERSENSTVPPEVRLVEADWTRFVETLLPYVLLAQFSKSPTMVASAAWALRHLSYLAPHLVLPPMMKRMYPALETVTETHQAFAALSTLAAVARPLLWAENFAGGAKHLVPLLQLSLPGIDPNDGNKTQVTLQFLMVVFMNVYLVDCSAGPIPDDASAEERDILMSTAYFEDWAMQMFDRLFSVLETLVPPSKKKNVQTTEGSLCGWIELISCRFFQQVSPPIFRLALDKVFTWLSTSMIMHLGKTAGKICEAAAEVNPQETLKRIVPFVAERITALLDAHATVDEVDEDSDAPLDDELQWYLNVLARVVIHTGEALIEYRDTLLPILDRGLRLKAAKAAKLCGKMLRHMLIALTNTYVRETCTLTRAQRAKWAEDPVGLFRQWGNSPDVQSSDNLAVEWHVASDAELEFASELVDLYYRPAVETLTRFVEGKLEYRHDVLLNTLMVVRNVVRVGLPIFPDVTAGDDDLYTTAADNEWDAPNGKDSFMSRIKLQLDVLPQHFIDQHSDNRSALMAVTHSFVEKLLETCEDDTKLFKLTIKIVYQLLCVRGITDRKYYRLSKVWTWLKQGSADLVRPGKRYSRAMLTHRINIQHLRRKNKGRTCILYTQAFRLLLRDLINLAASRYAVVRKRAQGVISHVTSTHPLARHDVFHGAVDMLDLKPDQMEPLHHRIKGALFMLCSKAIARLIMQTPGYSSHLAKRSLMLESNDRVSIQARVNHLFSTLSQENRATGLNAEMDSSLFQAAVVLHPEIASMADYFERESVALAAQRVDRTHKELLDCQVELAGLLETATTGWKFEVLVAGLLGSKVRERAEVPDVVVAYFTNALTSDSLKLRHLAVGVTSFILAITKQRPRKELFTFADNGAVAVDGAPESSDSDLRPWQPRAEIPKFPHCFSLVESAKPLEKDVYESTVFVDKNYIGWSLFPASARTYPSLKDQPILEPTAVISLTWNVISRAGFLERHCDFFSQDKADGTAAHFSDAQAELYKGFARNHGLKFMELARPQIERLLAPCDSDGVSETTAKFRCAGELVAGIVRGSKHWHFDEVQAMWKFVIPTLEEAASRVENHTISNFSSTLRYCVYDRDPRRFYPLTCLFFRPQDLETDQGDTSFEQYRYLDLFVSIAEELSWRGLEAVEDLLARIRPYAAHPYKLVREKIARCLAVIFRARQAPGRHGPDPVTVPFIEDVTRTILTARELPEEDEQKKSAVLLAKTVMKWATYVFYEGFDGMLVWHLRTLLPAIAVAPELSAEDDELTSMSKQALGFISQSKMIHQSEVEDVLKTVLGMVEDESWHVRERALHFVQVFFFRNLFFVPADLLAGTILKCLEDVQLEVRDVASATLSGMVRCGLVGDAMLQQCIKLSDTKIKVVKRRRGTAAAAQPPMVVSEEEKRARVLRHAGILGVQAFVAGYPYDIPQWLPEVLLNLSKKISDPEPLKASVKKTLGEFWRTHQDDRQALREAFDEDQFATLRDLVVGYNYYA
mmetsp:Transcript_5329/g.16136  ORF Transcript_5329/g.16136 Transcript_5329/m.16136 type:complete len:1865 (+) Transcript_5329:117-5711(+)